MPHSVYSRLSFDFTRFMPAGLTGTLSFTQLPRAPVNTVPRHTHKHTRIHTHTLTYIYIYIYIHTIRLATARSASLRMCSSSTYRALSPTHVRFYIFTGVVHTHTHKHVRALKTHTTTHAHTNNEDPKKKEKKIPLILPQFGR